MPNVIVSKHTSRSISRQLAVVSDGNSLGRAIHCEDGVGAGAFDEVAVVAEEDDVAPVVHTALGVAGDDGVVALVAVDITGLLDVGDTPGVHSRLAAAHDLPDEERRRGRELVSSFNPGTPSNCSKSYHTCVTAVPLTTETNNRGSASCNRCVREGNSDHRYRTPQARGSLTIETNYASRIWRWVRNRSNRQKRMPETPRTRRVSTSDMANHC